ncbi:hypothetical protein GN244_ATG16040 [Phytophthora infestans]|uniref:Uncharacterized protein n=1 Tax=Phytophthora infestans TaxID=4787 RepID=A0A833S422_PHYIN|nr:hypothetical protein GN244_ATG16040 [Phytophthora infestans]
MYFESNGVFVAERWKDVFSGRLAALVFSWTASRCSRLPPSANEVGISKLPFNNNFNSNYQYGHRGSHEKQHKPAAHFRICKTNAKYQPTKPTNALPRTDSMPAQLILLFPEDVPQDTRTSLAAPTYAEICDDSEPKEFAYELSQLQKRKRSQLWTPGYLDRPPFGV